MQYPSMSRTRAYTVSVPELNGGINLSVPPHRIADNQLSDSENVWYRDGMLQTRPALDCVSIAGHALNTDYRYGSVGDYGYITGLRNGTDENYRYITLVQKDGTVLPHHKMLGSREVHHMTLVSKNGSTENVIAYVQGDDAEAGVFEVNTTDAGLTSLSPYVPTVLMNGRPQADRGGSVNGVQLEPYNMLSDEYICTFTSDGKNLYYYLPEAADTIKEKGFVIKWYDGSMYVDVELSLTFDSTQSLYIGSTNVTGFAPVYDPSNGCFWFCERHPIIIEDDPNAAVAFPEGLDNNIVVKMKRSDTDAIKTARETILGMQFGTWFGGTSGTSAGTRLFMGGNKEHPNLVHWSAINNPLYFPENNYAYVGEDENAVTAFAKQGDMLVIFKERELYCTTYVQGGTVTGEDLTAQAVIDIEAAAAVFPIMQVHPEIGCDCPGTIQLCSNRLVWLNSDGNVYGFFSAGPYSEKNIRTLSLQVGKRLRSFDKSALKSATAARHEEQYLLLVGGEILAMDYSSYGFSHYSNFSTDEKAQKNVAWYIWKTEVALRALVSVGNSAVLIGTDGNEVYRHIFLLNDKSDEDVLPQYKDYSKTAKIVNVIQTKLYDFGQMDRRKRVDTVYLHISGDYGNGVDLEYISGDVCTSRCDRVNTTGRALESTPPFRVKPNMIRVRQFGIRITATGRIRVGGITLTYSTMGVVR